MNLVDNSFHFSLLIKVCTFQTFSTDFISSNQQHAKLYVMVLLFNALLIRPNEKPLKQVKNGNSKNYTKNVGINLMKLVKN